MLIVLIITIVCVATAFALGWRYDRQEYKRDYERWKENVKRWPEGYESKAPKKAWWGRSWSWFAGLGGVLLGSLIAFMIADANPDTQALEYEDTQIVALQDGSGVEGGGFLTLNTIGTKHEYIYYVRNDDGSFEQKQMDTASVKVFEEAVEQPYLREVRGKSKDLWHVDVGRIGWEFHVPKGSVVQNYTLDAK
jgi:hypothetical protein